MTEIKSSSNKIMIEFPKNLISPGDLERFIEKLKTEEISQKNAMSEDEACAVCQADCRLFIFFTSIFSYKFFIT